MIDVTYASPRVSTGAGPVPHMMPHAVYSIINTQHIRLLIIKNNGALVITLSSVCCRQLEAAVSTPLEKAMRDFDFARHHRFDFTIFLVLHLHIHCSAFSCGGKSLPRRYGTARRRFEHISTISRSIDTIYVAAGGEGCHYRQYRRTGRADAGRDAGSAR